MINKERELYITSGSNIGFDVALDWARKFAKFAGVAPPDPALRGTPEGYADYLRCQLAAEEKSKSTGKQCCEFLMPQLTGLEGKRVEVIDSDGNKRRFRVGKSTGWAPVHLELKGSDGDPISEQFKSVRVI